MDLSKFIVELLELSGLSDLDFCNKIGLSIDELNEIKSGVEENAPSITTLIKAFATIIFKKSTVKQLDETSKQLAQARAIVLTVTESEELTDHHQTTLTVATDLIDKARGNV